MKRQNVKTTSTPCSKVAVAFSSEFRRYHGGSRVAQGLDSWGVVNSGRFQVVSYKLPATGHGSITRRHGSIVMGQLRIWVNFYGSIDRPRQYRPHHSSRMEQHEGHRVSLAAELDGHVFGELVQRSLAGAVRVPSAPARDLTKPNASWQFRQVRFRPWNGMSPSCFFLECPGGSRESGGLGIPGVREGIHEDATATHDTRSTHSERLQRRKRRR